MIKTRLGVGGWISNIRHVRPDGSTFPVRQFKDNGPIFNRIVDAGLDMPAYGYWHSCFEVLSVGVGSSPTTDDMTKLESYNAHSNTYPSSSALNGYITDLEADIPNITLFRTFTLDINTGADLNLTEVGLGRSDEANPDIFSRIVPDTPIPYLNGLGLQITYSLKINWPAHTNTDVASSIQVSDGAGGLTTISGTSRFKLSTDTSPFEDYWDGARYGINMIRSDGYMYDLGYSKHLAHFLEPVSGMSSDTQGNPCAGIDDNGSLIEFKAVNTSNVNSKELYTAGDLQVIRRMVISSDMSPLLSFNSFGVGTGQTNTGGGPLNYSDYIFVADSPSSFVKQVGEQYNITQIISWDRA